MADAPKKKGRRSYLNDFVRGADGEYVYQGALHPYEGPVPWKRGMTVLWALTAVMAVAVVTAGCVPAAGTGNCPYVLLPYAASLLAVVSVVWLMARLTAGKESLRDYVYKATVKQFKVRGWAVAALSAAAVLGELIFLLRHGHQGLRGGTAAFLACLAAEFGASVGWTRYFGGLRWSK